MTTTPKRADAAGTYDRWPAVKEIVQGALARTAEERDEFVALACGSDDALRREVQSLINAALKPGSFLDAPAWLDADEDASRERDGVELMSRIAAALGERFTLQRELARGGMSRVFLAVERALGRAVVVKVLRPDLASAVSAERFAREVRLTARLQQANIVPVLTAGDADGLPYFTMPFVDGESLAVRLQRGQLAIADGVSILRDVARALAYAHERGIVHRDIKPDNVLLSRGAAVVTDFGIAKAILGARGEGLGASNSSPLAPSPSPLTELGTAIGTPAYMSPEQVGGDASVGPAADVYAFGVLAYEVLSGMHPFAAATTSREMMVAHLSEHPRPVYEQRRELPVALGALIMRCLAKDPAMRPADGARLLEALESAELSEARPTSDDARAPRSSIVNPAAFELYLRGRHLVERRSEGMHEALRCFEEAVRLDPGFPAPHAGIAYTYTMFGIYHALRAREAFPRARDSAERALALDPADALALVMRAQVALWHEWDFASAESRLRRALELAPGLHLAHAGLGYTLAAQGRFDEAIASLQRARELDPLSEFATYDLSWVLILAGRWDQALRELQPAVTRHPLVSELRRDLAFCLFYGGRLHDARAELERVLQLSPGDRWAMQNLVQVLAALGDHEQARHMLADVERRAAHEPVPLFGIAVMHHWLGDDDTAFEWLERSVEARDYWLVMLPYDPSLARLHGDPRFTELVRKTRDAGRGARDAPSTR